MESKLWEKYAKAWAACQNPPLDCQNPHFRNRYASLQATLAEVRRACAAQGLVYRQSLVLVDGTYMLSSGICTGDESAALSTMPIDMSLTSQQVGSALTYAKRQLAQLDWGIVGEEDEDGEAASKPVQAPRQQAPQRSDGGNRQKWLARIAELKMQCMQNGVREEGIDSYASANIGTADAQEMTQEQLLAFGQYLQRLASDSMNLRGSDGNQ